MREGTLGKKKKKQRLKLSRLCGEDGDALMSLFVCLFFWKRQCDGNRTIHPDGQAGKRATQQVNQQQQ